MINNVYIGCNREILWDLLLGLKIYLYIYIYYLVRPPQ